MMIKLFARHLKGKSRLIAAMFILGLIGAAVSLATPLIGKTFIDAVTEKGDYGIIPSLVAALAALALADFILGAVTRVVHSKLSAAVLVELRERLFLQCLDAPLEDLEKFRHGDLMNRFGADLAKIQTLLVDGVLGFVQNILFLIVAVVILVKLSATLALWSLLGLSLAVALRVVFGKPVEHGARGVREAMVGVSHFLAERLGALRAIRLHAAQQEERARFAGANHLLVKKLLRFQTLDSCASGLPGLALTASLAWIYLLGGRLLQSGDIKLGTFVAFVLYQGRLVGPALGLLGLLRNLQEGRVSLERVSELLVSERNLPAPVAAPCQGEGDIVLENITFAYPAKPPVLQNLMLQVERGERVALYGASGAGKSTLIQLLFGLRSPQEGVVRAGEQPGYAGSEPFLLHATVRENLQYGTAGGTADDLIRAARMVEAHEFISGLPDGYETVIGGRGLALSDGQRQRLGLARVVMKNPRIIVFDEAFSALDLETEARVRRNLFEHFAGRTMLFISHRLEGMEDFDRLLLMKDGRLRQVTGQELRREFAGIPLRPSRMKKTTRNRKAIERG